MNRDDVRRRDEFAMMAMPEVIKLVAKGGIVERGTAAQTVAYECYAIADAMMEARK